MDIGTKNIEIDNSRFTVRLKRNGKRLNLGVFSTLEEAVQARDTYLEKEKDVFLSSVTTGKPVINLVGKRCNKLIVIEYAGLTKNKTSHRWLCRCDCGKTVTVKSIIITTGRQKSCGCIKKEWIPNNTLEVGESSLNRIFRMYNTNAKRKNLEFSLSLEIFRGIISQDCHYCGQTPSNFFKRHDGNGYFLYNGIDRKDNNKGYNIENSLPCCTVCNRAKSSMNYQDFIDWIQRLIKNVPK